MAKAVRDVVVHQTSCLHERITDGRADKFETAALQRFAHRFGFGSRDRNLAGLCPSIDLRSAIDKIAKASSERAEVVLDFESGPGVRTKGWGFLSGASDSSRRYPSGNTSTAGRWSFV